MRNPTWHDIYMNIALLSAGRSKDPKRQVGAVLTKNNEIIGLGYNGTPYGVSDEEFIWTAKHENPALSKQEHTIHGEINAFFNAIDNNNFDKIRGSTMYVGTYPCHGCARILNKAQIGEIYHIDDLTGKDECVDVSINLLEKWLKASAQKIVPNFKFMYDMLSEWNQSQVTLEPRKKPSDINHARKNYLTWGEYFSIIAKTIATHKDVENCTVIVDSNNFVKSVQKNNAELYVTVPRATAYATVLPDENSLERLEQIGVDRLKVLNRTTPYYMHKKMSIESFHPDINRITKELTYQIEFNTGKKIKEVLDY